MSYSTAFRYTTGNVATLVHIITREKKIERLWAKERLVIQKRKKHRKTKQKRLLLFYRSTRLQY